MSSTASLPRPHKELAVKGIPTWFIGLWCILMPVTTFLLIPSVQGTIPAYCMAFASVLFVILSRDRGRGALQRVRYFKIGLLIGGLWFLLLAGSQLGHLLSNRTDFGDMFLNSPGDTRVVMRSVLFTQSLYLFACLLIALFFRFFFRPEWMRYVFWGAWFLVIYGIYEWVYFLIFQQPGDFLGNRTYGEDMRTGSWSQAIQIGPFNLLRIKSTFGEPSFFSAAVTPYLFLAVQHKRKLLSALLLFCLIFSTSTSSFIAFPFALLCYSLFQKKLNGSVAWLLILFVGVLATLYFIYPETFASMFTSKISGENDSGQLHQEANQATSEQVATFTVMNWVFGIGFGYYYGNVFNNVLINTGLIGLGVYIYAFLKPVFLLKSDAEGLPLKVCVATLFFLYFINVSELFLPTTWMFLGLAYWRLDEQGREAKALARIPTAGDTALLTPRGKASSF